MKDTNVRGELNTLYLMAIKEIGRITREIKTPLYDRIAQIRGVLNTLSDKTWELAISIEDEMRLAEALWAAREDEGHKDASPAETTAEEAETARYLKARAEAMAQVYKNMGEPPFDETLLESSK